MSAGSNRNYYVRNAQNDITGLIDASGTLVVEYKYDAWGKLLSTTGSLASTIGVRNPFRYRGYYYDTETGLYYVGSRYYDPEIRRFISADDVSSLDRDVCSIHQYNMMLYCEGNPVNKLDEDGFFSLPNFAKVVIGAVATVAAVGLTVATGGAALPVLVGVAASTVAGAAFGYVSGGKQGAINGAADGFMWGGIGELALSVVGAVKTVRQYKKTVDTYSSLTKRYKGSGLEAHHVIEKRLVKGSNLRVSKMPSVELTHSVHRGYTNAWRIQLAYGTRYTSGIAYKVRLYKVVNTVYKGNRVLKMAGRHTIFIMKSIK